MDYSAANTQLWNSITQIVVIAVIILLANVLRRKIGFVRQAMLPTAVLAGFILLGAKLVGIVKIDLAFFEFLTYHCIALGFIALSLRVPDEQENTKGGRVGLKSGAVIVGSYMAQAITGLLISLGLAYTVMPDLFKASGILLPMGYGQGPGQANNIGASYEALGFEGGRAFGLAIAAAGYISACVVGVAYMTWLSKKNKLKRVDHEDISGSVTIDTFQSDNEVPIAESLDRLSIQVALVLAVYGATFVLIRGITDFLSAVSPGVANTLNALLWGFNFMIGSGLAIALRCIFKKLHSTKIMTRQYQNNYLLSRISGLAFDIMIVAGIGSIEIDNLRGLWLPFVLMSVAGAFVTLWHLKFVCKKVYGDYYYEGLLSMYGMMTGTISSGILLLRELDPKLETPAANNLVIGSSFAIMLAVPLLILVGMAPKSPIMTVFVLLAVIVYYFILLAIVCHKGKKGAE
ncbi:MAG: hypothetical protein J6K37_02500 [Lachnospiraceae bacterium]|nr:hypothetical protein [Lachnospiraceae bacterium]